MTSRQNHFAATMMAVVTLFGLAASANAETTTRHYDRQGRLTGWSTQIGDEIRQYDQSGRLTGRTILRTNEGREYTPSGTLVGRTYVLPDGRVRHYDERGRLLGESR